MHRGRQARGWEESEEGSTERHEKGCGVRCLQLLISAPIPCSQRDFEQVIDTL